MKASQAFALAMLKKLALSASFIGFFLFLVHNLPVFSKKQREAPIDWQVRLSGVIRDKGKNLHYLFRKNLS